MKDPQKRTFRTPAVLVVVAAILLPMLFVAAPGASAAPRGRACPAGVIVRGVCVVDHGAPTCPDGFVFDGATTCVSTVEPDREPVCPADSSGEPGGCFVVVEPVLSGFVCDAGDLVDDRCEMVAEAVDVCPDGYGADDALGGLCARFEPADQLPPTCPVGSRGVPGGCYILVARGPRQPPRCVEGTLVAMNCLIVGLAPVSGPASCPVSATVFGVDGRCFRLVPPDSDGNCRAGTTPSPDAANCEQPVELVPGVLQCEAGFGLINGRCIRYVPAPPGEAVCPVGSVEDSVGDCRKPVADASGGFACADPAAALNGTSCVFIAPFEPGCPVDFSLVAGRCVRFEPARETFECPTGPTAGADETCRSPVADAQGEPFCADPEATLVDGGCEIREAALCGTGELIDGSCIESTRPGRARFSRERDNGRSNHWRHGHPR